MRRARKYSGFFILLAFFAFGIAFSAQTGEDNKDTPPIKLGMAVEFNDHAAAAYVAREQGWFEQTGFDLSTYESYVTGMALASALARRDIDVAYMCLVPAISVYANAGVPIKILAGTHQHGYGVVVNGDKIKAARDLEKPDVRIGCVREGGTVDVLLHKTMETHDLNRDMVIRNIRRMNPPRQILAIKAGKLDAAFLPEHWATVAEELGFNMLLTSQDVWPGMQGSVLVVRDDFVKDHPEAARQLVEITQKATDWINRHPGEAAGILARCLSVAGGKNLAGKEAESLARLGLTDQTLSRSMKRLVYRTDLNVEVIQNTIDYLAKLGYIKEAFDAHEFVDPRWVNHE
jgi:NitT/TauT family transport system substrate-binding protein